MKKIRLTILYLPLIASLTIAFYGCDDYKYNEFEKIDFTLIIDFREINVL